jgi:hypothetical protein
MIFDKLANTPVFSPVTGPGFNIGQSAYTLPDTATKIWHENRDGLHANYEQYFDNLIRKGDSTSWGINSSENYLNGIVISNSSTAANASEASGSNTRYLDIAGQTLYHAVRHCWRHGILQFFPEHQDYDAVDWFRVNQPYVVTSQGSSGSEGEEVQRCNEIVKALRPDVREWMIANQRVGDIVAYLMRSNLPGGYLDPKNHQPVLSTKWPSAEDLALAVSLTIDTMPPKLSIKLISDSLKQSNLVRTDEVIGLKRVDLTQSRVIEVELICDKPSVDFYWLKCQGESTIERNTKYRATITIPFQANFEIEAQDGHRLLSNRIDIIAVAYDGTHFSCPVFISEYTTPEARESRPKMNEIGVTADDSFVCKLNGIEVSSGYDWKTLIRKPVEWEQGNNLVEIVVKNVGGSGGLLASMFVGEVETVSDNSWEASMDKLIWKKPDQVTSHNGSVWHRYGGVTGVKVDTAAKWIWLSEAPETATVYFRKTVIVGTPTPIPDSFEGKNVVKQIVKEGEWIRLKAPDGFMLGDVLFASYGTSTNYVRGACHSSASMNIVAAAKTAKSLDVQGSYLVFGDPCYGVNKTLAVAVELVPEVSPVPTPTPTPMPDQSAEIERLKSELAAMTIERNMSIQNEKDTQHQLEVLEEKILDFNNALYGLIN